MKTCMLCCKAPQLKSIEYCMDCLVDLIKSAHEISVLINDGHPKHCAYRQTMGDGECECDFYKMGYNPESWHDFYLNGNRRA